MKTLINTDFLTFDEVLALNEGKFIVFDMQSKKQEGYLFYKDNILYDNWRDNMLGRVPTNVSENFKNEVYGWKNHKYRKM